MSIEYVSGDMFATAEKDVMVCTVNCVGAMGKGVALAFRNKYPLLARWYFKKCLDRAFVPGGAQLYAGSEKPFLICVATKLHWYNPSRIEWIQTAISHLKIMFDVLSLEFKDTRMTVALPPLGCGHGKLSWDDVKPMIEKAFSDSPYTVYVYEPRQQEVSI